jgi:hypothetical protein
MGSGSRPSRGRSCFGMRPTAPMPSIAAFAGDYGTKWPKAVAKITDDAEALLCFYDFPLLLCQAAAA